MEIYTLLGSNTNLMPVGKYANRNFNNIIWLVVTKTEIFQKVINLDEHFFLVIIPMVRS